jgi:hypothetical protein
VAPTREREVTMTTPRDPRPGAPDPGPVPKPNPYPTGPRGTVDVHDHRAGSICVACSRNQYNTR